MKREYRSEDYNFNFDTETGYFERWGKTFEDDPEVAPAPEILDIEIASGYCKGNCPHCYKANSLDQSIHYMSLNTYKKLFDIIKTPVLTQIAFGITDIDANPYFWDIMHYTRDNGIIPNYTTNGIGVTEEVANQTAKVCGAVAVSVYRDKKELAYKAIKMFTDAGMTQVNIHFMLANETLDLAVEVLQDIKTRPELAKLNAIVFLQYKDKNPDAHFTNVDFRDFKALIHYCLAAGIRFGFDSCSSAMFMKAVADRGDARELIQSVDNCESTLMSFYINANGYGYPCSFLEGIDEWADGINILESTNFVADVWHNERVEKYRSTLLNSSKSCVCEFSGSCRSCFVYEINKCKGI